MNIQKTLLATAISAACVMSINAAQAAVFTPGAGVPKVVTVESNRNVVDIPANFDITLGAGESLSSTDSIEFTLSGANTFVGLAATDLQFITRTCLPSGTPVTAAGTCPIVGDTLTLSAPIPNAFALISGANATTAKFRTTLSTGIPENSIIRLITGGTGKVNASSTSLSSTPFTVGTLSAEVTLSAKMNGFVGGAAQELYGPLASANFIDLVPTFTASLDSATTPIKGTFDVKTGFIKLTTGLTTSASGKINLAVSTAAVIGQNVLGLIPTASPVPAKVLLKISGPMAGVVGIDSTTPGVITSATSTGGIPSPATVANNFFIDATNNTAYAVLSLFPSPTSFPVEFQFDGTSAKSAKDFTVEAAYLGDLNYSNSQVIVSGVRTIESFPILSAANFANFNRNGSSFEVNFFGAANKIRITDVSGSILPGAGKITVTAWTQQGTLVALAAGSTFVINPIGPRETRVIAGADLLAAYPGATHFEFAIESPEVEAASLKTVNGAITSTSVYTNKGNSALIGGI